MRVKQLGFQFNTRSPAKSIVIDSMWVARESSSPMSRHVRHRHRGDVRDVQLAAAGDVAHLPRLHARKRHPVPYRPDAGHPSILAQVFRALALFLLVATWVYYGAWADGLMTPLAIRRFGRCDRRALRQIEGSRLRSAARLSTGAKCGPAKPGRNRDGASGGNCTRAPSDASHSSQIVCENGCLGLSERCREDAALRETAVAWQMLSPAVRQEIMDLVRGAANTASRISAVSLFLTDALDCRATITYGIHGTRLPVDDYVWSPRNAGSRPHRRRLSN